MENPLWLYTTWRDGNTNFWIFGACAAWNLTWLDIQHLYMEMIFVYIFQSIQYFCWGEIHHWKKNTSSVGFRPRKPDGWAYRTRFLWQESHGLRFYGMLKKHSAWPVLTAGICYQETSSESGWIHGSLGVRTHPQNKAPQGESCEIIYILDNSSVRNSWVM